MRRDDPQPWKRRCPVLHGPRVHEFWSGYGWLLLLLSLVIHTAVMLLLPVPTRTVLTPQQDILIALREPPPPPPPDPQPEPEPKIKPAAEPEPQPSPDPPAEAKPEPGPVIGKEGEGPGAIHSGEVLPPFPEAKPEPQPEAEHPPPAPAPAPEQEVDVQALLQAYAGAVKAQVLSRKYYPGIAERLGHSGNVKVSFTIAADGQLADVRIKASSGWDELDEAAAEAVRSAAPFDPIPALAVRDELSLSITLKYTLD